MRKINILIIILSVVTPAHAQQTKIDSLQYLMSNAKADTAKITLFEKLGQAYRDQKKLDSSIFCFKKALEINEHNNYSRHKQCLNISAIQFLLYEAGNYAESLKYASRQMQLAEELKDLFQMAFANATFAHNYKALGEYRQSVNYYLKARKLFTTHFNYKNEIGKYAYIDQCIGEAYLKLNMFDSALIYTRQSLSEKGPDPGDELYSNRILGDIHFATEEYETALNYYKKFVDEYIKYNNPPFIGYKQNRRDLGFVFNSLAKIFQKTGQNDSSFFYAKKALENALAYQDQENIFNAATVLYEFYKNNNEYDAFKYYKIATAAKDSMASIEKIKQIQILTFNEQMREKQQAEANAKAAAKIRLIITIVAVIVLILSFLIWNRIRQLRLKYKVILEKKEAEKLKAKYETELLELEAKALRAQMNPHFIFNCLNSIKALMQEKETDKGVMYLTTFSKLIRTLFNNADKKEITLYDEIETCKLYLQLEAMRFNNKLSYSVNIDKTVDLKSILVPALIIQPFIENAIWHGIVPKESDGAILLNVEKENGAVKIIVEDDGIGREASQQNKPASSITHQSKGVNLTQSRLELDNLSKQRKANLEIIDKKDEKKMPTGTVAIITLSEES